MKKKGEIRFTIKSKHMAEEYYVCAIENKAVVLLSIDKNTTYVKTKDIKENIETECKNEIVIGPFIKIDNIKEMVKTERTHHYKEYNRV